MSSKEKRSAQVLQGNSRLIVLRTLEDDGTSHAYQVASRLQQMSDQSLELNQGTLYPALVRLSNTGWITAPGKTERNRDANSTPITSGGRKALENETKRAGGKCRSWWNADFLDGTQA